MIRLKFHDLKIPVMKILSCTLCDIKHEEIKRKIVNRTIV
jgi:hypothetical protein